MLGCEYGCRDAVEVLLRNGADVSLVDALGHDCTYYARIGDNVDILALLKTAIEDSNKGRKSMPVSRRRFSFLVLDCFPLSPLDVFICIISHTGSTSVFEQAGSNYTLYTFTLSRILVYKLKL